MHLYMYIQTNYKVTRLLLGEQAMFDGACVFQHRRDSKCDTNIPPNNVCSTRGRFRSSGFVNLAFPVIY